MTLKPNGRDFIKLDDNVRDFFYYDETSPTCLRWKVERRCGKGHWRLLAAIGDPTPEKATSNSGYLTVYYNGRNTFVHRIVYFLAHGEIPDGMFVDHINRNRTDNRIENLRLVTRAANNQNLSVSNRNNTGVTGIHIDNKIINGRHYSYYAVTYTLLSGKAGRKLFSIQKLGEDMAFQAAKEFRAKMVEKMNSEGGNYPT